MTYYDDAELAAIAVVRVAAREIATGRPLSREMIEVAARLIEAHNAEPMVVKALVCALARFGANTAKILAEYQGTSVDEHLDNREMFKLGQHFDDFEEDE